MIYYKKLILKAFVIFIFLALCSQTHAIEVNVDTLWTEAKIIERCTSVVTIAESIEGGYPIKIGFGMENKMASFFIDSTCSGATTAKPPANDYHDRIEWFAQRYCNIIDDILPYKASEPRDWSSYNYLRFDVYSHDTLAVLGVRVKDASDYKRYFYNEGSFSAIGTFIIPKGQWVTCNFPLKDMVEQSELQLDKMQGFLIQINGFYGSTELQMKDIRLVGSGTSD